MLSGRTNFTWEQRIEAVEMYSSGNYSYTEVAGKFGTIISTLKNWINSYKNNGIDGLKESRTWRKSDICKLTMQNIKSIPFGIL